MYVCENEEKFGLFVFCSLSFVCALWSVPLSRLCGILKRDERRVRREREKTPPVFQKKRGPHNARKKSKREREKNSRDTKKKEGKKKKKNVDESSVSRAVVVHRRERVGTKAVARGDRRKRRRSFV